jgi:hypothetical protein
LKIGRTEAKNIEGKQPDNKDWALRQIEEAEQEADD